MDLTDKVYELELKKNKFSSELKEKLEKIKKFEIELQDKERKIKEKNLILNQLDNNLNNLKNLDTNNTKEIDLLLIEKNELFNSLQLKYNLSNTLYNLSNKDLCEKKFTQQQIEEQYIYTQIQKDLLDYQKYIVYKMESKREKVNDIIINFNDLIKTITNDFEIKLFGSYAHNLSVPWSNVDLLIVNKNNNENESIDILDKLKALLNTQPWVNEIELDNISYIPNIKIFTNNTYEELSISLSFDKEYGLLKSIDLINKYIEEFPMIVPIMYALKTIFEQSKLNSIFSGGLPSYGLLLLLVSFLQGKFNNKNISDYNNEYLLGQVFVGFLGHYGFYFDYQKLAITTHLPKSGIFENQPNMEFDGNYKQCPEFHDFLIIDPLNTKNNVAKNSYNFMSIKIALIIAYIVAKEDCDCGCHYGKASYLYDYQNIEHSILKRMFNSVKRFTENI